MSLVRSPTVCCFVNDICHFVLIQVPCCAANSGSDQLVIETRQHVGSHLTAILSVQCMELWSFSCDPIFSPHQFSEAYRILCSPQYYNNDSQTLNLHDSHDWTKEYCGHFCLLCLCYMTLQLAAMTWNKSSNLVMQTWCGFDVDIRAGNAPSGSIHITLISSTIRVWIFLLHILETNKSTFTADLSLEFNHVVESLQKTTWS